MDEVLGRPHVADLIEHVSGIVGACALLVTLGVSRSGRPAFTAVGTNRRARGRGEDVDVLLLPRGRRPWPMHRPECAAEFEHRGTGRPAISVTIGPTPSDGI